ncbi:hypothetical protein CSPX01_14778 [Colletotrichum filicis]|nr:hypothetical protein CSPX01_14778 [Colletotrichum filicis]
MTSPSNHLSQTSADALPTRPSPPTPTTPWGGSAFRAERALNELAHVAAETVSRRATEAEGVWRDRKIIGSRAGRAMLRPRHFASATSRPAERARLIQRIEGFSRSEGHEDCCSRPARGRCLETPIVSSSRNWLLAAEETQDIVFCFNIV